MKKKTLLIADDDQRMHDLYPQYLGDTYEYLHAYNGVDALVLAVDLVPDLIILDVVMPGLDGRAICKKLKTYPKTQHMRVVMVTGKRDQSDRLVGFEVGADDYLEKPYSLEILARSIEKQLR
jgi:two-component system phosphate regulon response regulator PhoB